METKKTIHVGEVEATIQHTSMRQVVEQVVAGDLRFDSTVIHDVFFSAISRAKTDGEQTLTDFLGIFDSLPYLPVTKRVMEEGNQLRKQAVVGLILYGYEVGSDTEVEKNMTSLLNFCARTGLVQYPTIGRQEDVLTNPSIIHELTQIGIKRAERLLNNSR